MFKISARTILELGSELISSDIIAFYELVKNAIDAGSTSGVDIHFNIVLRRNSYFKIRESAQRALSLLMASNTPLRSEAQLVSELIEMTTNNLDLSSGIAKVDEFSNRIISSETVSEFLELLDEAYFSLNTIEIIDKGSGMSLDEIKLNYLTIGTPSRKREVDRVMSLGAGKTPYLGEKGIGRLSVMRLGERLHLESARLEDDRINLLDLDWRKFADVEAMVEDIKVEPVQGTLKQDPKWSGTRLVIGDLSEDWTEKRVRELAEYDFARLTDPFVDPKNRPRIALYWNGTRIAIPFMDQALIDNAHAMFKGKYIAGSDEPELRVQLEAFNLGYPHPREVDSVTLTLPDLESLIAGTSHEVPLSALTSVGSFEFESYWYNRRYLTGIDTIGNQRAVRELQKKWSGILLFRDSFRVFPYGDDEDDWLGLDRKALGRPGYVLNKAQFVGHVQISRGLNPGLVDQTNREGLRATPEQKVFVSLLQHVVRDMLWDFFRDMDRRYKKQPVELGDIGAQVKSLEARTKTALTKVRQLVPKQEAEVVEELQHTLNELNDLLSRSQQRIVEVEEDSRQMVQMAGVGLMVEVVAHELARAAESALEAIEGLRGKDLPANVHARLETLRSEMKNVTRRLRVLDQLSVSGRQRPETFDLCELAEELKDGHATQFERHKVQMQVTTPSKPLRVKLAKGMVIQILENLVSNSLYWMQMRSERESRYLPRITIRIEADPPTIFYSDNGRGISPDHREKIFRPFWSLKEKSRRRGLGLFIARENANYLGGNLILSERADSETGRLHEFVLELPDGAVVK